MGRFLAVLLVISLGFASECSALTRAQVVTTIDSCTYDLFYFLSDPETHQLILQRDTQTRTDVAKLKLRIEQVERKTLSFFNNSTNDQDLQLKEGLFQYSVALLSLNAAFDHPLLSYPRARGEFKQGFELIFDYKKSIGIATEQDSTLSVTSRGW